jgi:hypothetical protein
MGKRGMGMSRINTHSITYDTLEYKAYIVGNGDNPNPAITILKNTLGIVDSLAWGDLNGNGGFGFAPSPCFNWTESQWIITSDYSSGFDIDDAYCNSNEIWFGGNYGNYGISFTMSIKKLVVHTL